MTGAEEAGPVYQDRTAPGPTAVPVADAAAWLARQGVEVPVPVRSGSGPGERPVRRSKSARGGEGAGAGDRAAADKGDADADPYAVARSIVLRRLAGRDHTRQELARAMARKNVPPEVADQVLDRLAEVGLVDDASFAREWVESRQQRRHLSAPALRRELQARGVDRDEIEVAVGSVGYGDELAAARELARRRLAALDGQPYPVQYRRIVGALGRRGFGAGVVAQVLREVLKEG